MAKKQSQIDKVTQLKDQASAKFEKAVTASEKKIFDEAVTLIRELETTPDGKIKASVANLKRLAQIRTKLAKVANDKEYLKAVKELAGEFDAIYQAQAQYFSTLTSQMHHESKYATMKQLAVENTVGGLSGAGLQANVTDKLNDMLLRAVTSGAKYADLIEEMRTYLKGDGEHPGALTRYASTYTVTALSQYAGQNNKLLTDDLGCEWFEYVGSEIETTREFCDHLCDKRYIHKSEIPEILKGHIDGHKCKIYAKTGLPYGLIEGTTPENFQVNVGGWNCRHQLVPIAKEAVPPEIRARFEKPKEEPQQQTEGHSEWEEWMAQNAKWLADTKTNYGHRIKAYGIDMSVFDNQSATKEQLETAKANVIATYTDKLTKWFKVQDQLRYQINKAKKLGLTQLALDGNQVMIENLDFGENEIKSLEDYNQRIITNMAETKRISEAIKKAQQEGAVIPKQAQPASQKPSQKKIDEAIKEIKNNTKKQKQHVPIDSTKTRQQQVIDELGVDYETARDLADAVYSFTYQWDYEIRAVQSGRSYDKGHHYGHTEELIRHKAEKLEEFIKRAPKWDGGPTYRGIALSKPAMESLKAALMAGTADMLGTSSWSTSERIASAFAESEKGKPYSIVLKCKKQTMGTSIEYLSKYADKEEEVIVSKDCKYKWVEQEPRPYTFYEVWVVEPV